MKAADLRIDLNCDLGEMPAAIADGTQEALLRSITSANIACGGHAGDEATMRTTIQQAQKAGVAIGAHPGYADKENFGRLELQLSADEIADSVFQQIVALAKIAEECGARLAHVKPHGALYNQAAKDRHISQAIANGVKRWGSSVILVGLAGSLMLEMFREEGFSVAAEAFADRRYEADGSLRSRKFDDALIRDAAQAARQALSIVERGSVTASDGTEVAVKAQTICIHGDTPGAPAIAAAVAQTLKESGISLRPRQEKY